MNKGINPYQVELDLLNKGASIQLSDSVGNLQKKAQIYKTGAESTELRELKERLMGIKASAYGTGRSAWEILQLMSDEDLEELFSGALEGILQAGDKEP